MCEWHTGHSHILDSHKCGHHNMLRPGPVFGVKPTGKLDNDCCDSGFIFLTTNTERKSVLRWPQIWLSVCVNCPLRADGPIYFPMIWPPDSSCPCRRLAELPFPWYMESFMRSQRAGWSRRCDTCFFFLILKNGLCINLLHMFTVERKTCPLKQNTSCKHNFYLHLVKHCYLSFGHTHFLDS